jgi:predicted nucleic acid-binding protein
MTIDTNIVVAYLAGDHEVITLLSKLKKEGTLLFLSTVAEAEVRVSPRLLRSCTLRNFFKSTSEMP